MFCNSLTVNLGVCDPQRLQVAESTKRLGNGSWNKNNERVIFQVQIRDHFSDSFVVLKTTATERVAICR